MRAGVGYSQRIAIPGVLSWITGFFTGGGDYPVAAPLASASDRGVLGSPPSRRPPRVTREKTPKKDSRAGWTQAERCLC
jgi:hypothetical protein